MIQKIGDRGALFDMAGRTALVTGASSGLGARFARVLASNGAKVVLAARREAMLHALRDEILASGGEAMAVTMDAADEASTIAAYDRAQAAFGVVDTVVANAGIGQVGSALKLPVEDFDGIFAINTRGAFLTAREGARRMQQAGFADGRRGRVILNASITAKASLSGVAAYGASKAAVVQMGRLFAREWARIGINVNILCPGYIMTELNNDMFASEGGRKLASRWLRGQMMDMDALDGALLYLASDASRFTTGAVIDVDDAQML